MRCLSRRFSARSTTRGTGFAIIGGSRLRHSGRRPEPFADRLDHELVVEQLGLVLRRRVGRGGVAAEQGEVAVFRVAGFHGVSLDFQSGSGSGMTTPRSRAAHWRIDSQYSPKVKRFSVVVLRPMRCSSMISPCALATMTCFGLKRPLQYSCSSSTV